MDGAHGGQGRVYPGGRPKCCGRRSGQLSCTWTYGQLSPGTAEDINTTMMSIPIFSPGRKGRQDLMDRQPEHLYHDINFVI